VKPRNVDEEDADETPLLSMRLRREGGATVQAEARDVRVLLTTCSANRHADSL
jgi:hypothetical protein